MARTQPWSNGCGHCPRRSVGPVSWSALALGAFGSSWHFGQALASSSRTASDSPGHASFAHAPNSSPVTARAHATPAAGRPRGTTRSGRSGRTWPGSAPPVQCGDFAPRISMPEAPVERILAANPGRRPARPGTPPSWPVERGPGRRPWAPSARRPARTRSSSAPAITPAGGPVGGSRPSRAAEDGPGQ